MTNHLLKVVSQYSSGPVCTSESRLNDPWLVIQCLAKYQKHDPEIAVKDMMRRIADTYKTKRPIVISRSDDYKLIISLVYALSRTRSGLQIKRLRWDLKHAETAYINNTYDHNVARELIKMTEMRIQS